MNSRIECLTYVFKPRLESFENFSAITASIPNPAVPTKNASLTATVSEGAIYWYDAPTGGNFIASPAWPGVFLKGTL